MKRTIAHYTDATAYGGAERALLTLCAGLDSASWRQLLVHRPEAPVRLIREAAALGVETRVSARAEQGRDFAGLHKLTRLLRQERVAVLHAHLPWPLRCTRGLVAAILARTPAIIATQQLYATLPLRRRLRQRALSQGVHRYVAVSQAMADEMARDHVVPARKLRVVRNSVPAQAFNRPPDPALRAMLTGARDRAVVLTLARLVWRKGLGTLLDAAASVPEVVFAIAGEGDERSMLETRIRQLGLEERVRILGQRDDIPALLASCDLFVLPSLFEGLPLSILEAMAAGKPVIATAVPGTREAVSEGETGLLFPPGDAPALARAITTVLADRGLASRLGRAGQVRVRQEFSAEMMTRQVEAVYGEVLRSASATAAAPDAAPRRSHASTAE
jgi:glycosyltransferase involved in cell wall biosynthesis